MPSLLLNLTPAGGPDELRRIAAELRSMNDARVGRVFRSNLRGPVREMQTAVRAKIAAIPTHDGHSGLRVRLMRCVRVISRTVGPGTTVAVYMDVDRMPSGQYALPLTEEGLKIWMHPVFGNDPWVIQAPHPYFRPVVAALSGTARAGVEKAVQEIRQALEG